MAMSLVVIDDEPASREGLQVGLGQHLDPEQMVIEQDLAAVPDEVLAAAPVLILGYNFLSNVVELRQRNLFKPGRIIVYGREQQARMAGLHRLAFVPRQIGMDRLWRTVKMIDRGIVPVSAVTSFVEHPDLPDLAHTSTVHLIKGRIDPAGLDRAQLILRFFLQDNLTTKELVRALAKASRAADEHISREPCGLRADEQDAAIFEGDRRPLAADRPLIVDTRPAGVAITDEKTPLAEEKVSRDDEKSSRLADEKSSRLMAELRARPIDEVEIDAVFEAALSVFLVKDRRELREQLVWMLANSCEFDAIIEPNLALCARRRRAPSSELL